MIYNICSNFVYSKLYYDFYKAMMDKREDCKMYCPVRKEGANTKLNYVDFSDEYIKKLNENAMVSKCFSKLDRFTYFRKRRMIFNDFISKNPITDKDYVIAHSTMTDGYIAYQLKKKYGTRYSVFVQNTDINVFFAKIFFLRRLGRRILALADRIIFSSEAVKDEFVNKYLNDSYLDKIDCIPFGIDSFYFENKGNKKQLSDKISILSVGSINKNKNQLGVARALADCGLNIQYNIVGSIADNKVYEELVKYPFVKYLGIKKGSELIECYRENDIFVLNSKYETFGLVYAEAMSQGLPVIYTKKQGFDGQFLDGVVGYGAGDLTEAIMNTIKNYSSLSSNAISLVDKFKWENIVDSYFKNIK